MTNSIRQTIDNCKVCREDRPAQAMPAACIAQPSSALYPMNEVRTDLFDVIGKKWIVLVDRYSGYAWTHELRHTDTATVVGQLSDCSRRLDGQQQLERTVAHNSERSSHLSLIHI